MSRRDTPCPHYTRHGSQGHPPQLLRDIWLQSAPSSPPQIRFNLNQSLGAHGSATGSLSLSFLIHEWGTSVPKDAPV